MLPWGEARFGNELAIVVEAGKPTRKQQQHARRLAANTGNGL
nr:hypothetical protein [Tanacetum cinerariifolium]